MRTPRRVPAVASRALPAWEQCWLALLLCALFQSLSAETLSKPDGDAMGLMLLGPGGVVMTAAPQLNTDVAITINGLIARARVTQRFRNPTDQWLEGVYVFPLPDDAAVDRLRMRVGPRLVEGEIQEREQAKRQYASAKAKGQVASLVRQQRPNIFTTAVANIPPGESVEVMVEYQQHLEWRQDTFSLRFPMVVAPRYIPGDPLELKYTPTPVAGWSPNTDSVPDASEITPPVAMQPPNDFNRLALRIVLNAGLPLETVESLYHPVTLNALDSSRYEIELAEGDIPADRDFVLRWAPVAASQPRAALFRERWGDRHYALMLLMPPTASTDAPVRKRELVMVIDTSGSMHGASIAQARAGVLHALSKLRPQDHFNVIQFNDEVSGLFDAARPASAVNLREAVRYVEDLEADGGTEMLPALQRALINGDAGGRLRQVVFLTDGAVGNEQALFESIEHWLGENRLFTVGIGSAPNAYFMRRAARVGRGTYTFIGSTAEVRQEIQNLFDELSRPVLTDLSVNWEVAPGASTIEMAVEDLQDLYAGRPLVIAMSADQKPQSATVTGRFGHKAWSHPVRFDKDEAADGIHALWAKRRIDALMDARVSGVDLQEIRERVVELALAHHLVSRFTSLVAVDKTPIRSPDDPLLSRPVGARMPAGWSTAKVFGQLPATATPAPLLAMLGLMMLLSTLGLWWIGRRPC